MSAVGVIGACNVDLVAYVPRLPVEGETLKGSKFEQGFGGKGANQAVQAAKLGAEALFISKVGEDSFGKQFREQLAKFNISDEFVFSDSKESTGLAPIAVDAKGNNSIIIIPGANDLLTKEEITTAKDALKKCKIFLAQLELPLEINIAALQLAKSLGITTVLNTAPAPSEPLPKEIYQYVDIICANQPEIQSLSEYKVNSTKDAEQAAKIVLDHGAEKVILTLGSLGCILVEKDKEPVVVPAEKVENVVDTSGAGDSFLGSFAFFYAKGCSIETALRRANIVASKSVQKNGTQSSYSSREDLDASLFEF